ncbi:TraX family protein [Sporosalibacterium faouarense]|uniref:TraX family protein n=1 Tax=Sporosalibacterium faouarense TaxID=516123 RepID=UPI00192C6F91|nr:TraX family protein [Sporosalibacterium faouarense]
MERDRIETSEKSLALGRNDTLKIIAMVTMLIDHIGYQLFPTIIVLRIIGRIAYPIFAYQLTVGYRKTSNLKKYFTRLLIFSVISQIPYMFFSPGKLNIMPTLALGLIAIHLYEEDRKLLSFLMVIIAEIFKFQYGGYGLLMIMLFYIFYTDKPKITISFLTLNILYYISGGSIIQTLSILALPFILGDIKIKTKVNKFIGYWFYPVHITIIVLIKALI